MSFKDISYLGLWRPFCSAELKLLCHFGRGYNENRFELGPVVQMSSRHFLPRALAVHLFGGVEPFVQVW